MKLECFTCDAERKKIKNTYKYECVRANKIIQLNDVACDKYNKSEMMLEIREEMRKIAKRELEKLKGDD